LAYTKDYRLIKAASYPTQYWIILPVQEYLF
jgi:hypothetical protein